MKKNSSSQAAEVMVVDAPSMSPAVCQTIAKQISQETEDAFYLFDVGDVIKKYNNWGAAMPRVAPFYAVKCNNNPVLLRVLAALGAGFDCASKAEIQLVMELGVKSDRIIFANPCKQTSHVKHAMRHEVDLMTFDNEAELRKLQNIAPNARLVLRIRVDATAAQCPLGVKFGAEPSAAPRLLKLALAMHLTVVGVSFHVGSGCREPAVFQRAISAARVVFDEAARLGQTLTLLDIGGGFPGERGQSLQPCAEVVNEALQKWFPEAEGVRVIAEPGRYMAASAFTLATQVTSVRLHEKAVDYYINDGVYGAFNCVLYDHQVCLPYPLSYDKTTADNDDTPPATVWGPTCDSMDCVCEGVSLPKLEPGSWLLWENMGAYTLAAAGTFNGFPRASVRAVIATPLSELVRAAVGHLTPLPEPAIPVAELSAEHCVTVAEN